MPPRRAGGWHAALRGLVFALASLPLASLLWGAARGDLGANPIETFTRGTGEWTLRLLLITLALTPLRELTGQTAWLVPRRMLGLFAFFYASVHLLSYLWLDQFFWWGEIAADLVERPFIAAGMAAFALMLPLALTSTRAAMRRLGRNWKRLHRLVYAVAALGVLHHFWLVKADTSGPLLYAAALAVLLGYRMVRPAGRRLRGAWRGNKPEAERDF